MDTRQATYLFDSDDETIGILGLEHVNNLGQDHIFHDLFSESCL